MSVSDSRIAAIVQDAERRLRAAAEESRVLSIVRRLGPTVSASAEDAGVTRAAHTLEAYVRASFLYRWLTKEPEPEVIVIDLRETWTVGPLIAVLDRAIHFAERSIVGRTLTRWSVLVHRELRAAPLQVVGLLGLGVGAGLLVPALLQTSLTTGFLALLFAAGGLVALRDDRPWHELRDTRPVQLAIAILEPPEPIEDEPRRE